MIHFRPTFAQSLLKNVCELRPEIARRGLEAQPRHNLFSLFFGGYYLHFNFFYFLHVF